MMAGNSRRLYAAADAFYPLLSTKEKKMISFLKSLIRDEEGATMVEYGLLVALIAMVALVGITLLGTNLQSLYTTVAGSV
jgi:pilus assembly protein Flp/PilA